MTEEELNSLVSTHMGYLENPLQEYAKDLARAAFAAGQLAERDRYRKAQRLPTLNVPSNHAAGGESAGATC